MAAAVSAPVTAAVIGDISLFPMLLGFALLVLWKHRENIVRLTKGTEPRIGSTDLVDRLRLVRSPGIGPVTYRQLIARFGSAAAALAAVPDLARRGGGKAPTADQPRRGRARDRQGREARRAVSGARPGALSAPARRDGGRAAAADRQGQFRAARPAGRGDRRRAQRFGGGLPLRARTGARPWAAGTWSSCPALRAGIDSAAHDGALDSGTIGVRRRRHRRLLPARERGAAEGDVRSAGWWSPKCRRGLSRGRATSPTATGSSPGSAAAPSWSRPRRDRAR